MEESHTDSKEQQNDQIEFDNYISKHGYHFTDTMADKAIANLSTPSWNTDEVYRLIGKNNLKSSISNTEVTFGDIAYLSNLIYQVLYPDIISTELNCIHSAIKMLNEMSSISFSIWLQDIMKRGIEFKE